MRKLSLLLAFIVTALIVVLILLPPAPYPRHESSNRNDQTEQEPGSESSVSQNTEGVTLPPQNQENHEDQAERFSVVPPEISSQSDDAQHDSADEPAAAIPQRSGKLVIVIDDVGYNTSGLEPFLELTVPVTFAVLPQLEFSQACAEMVSAAGQELILHLPMESVTGQYPGPGTLDDEMDIEQLRAEISADADSVPGIVGMNNHMGSQGTEDVRIVREVLEFAKSRGLFFLDSKTTAKSAVPLLAEAIEIPYLERDVFLDNEHSREFISQALDMGLQIVEQQGVAIMIGHVWTEILPGMLEDFAREAIAQGYEFVTLASLLEDGN